MVYYDFELIAEPPQRIIIKGASLSGFEQSMPGIREGDQYSVAFTKENAASVRKFLRGRSVKISERDKAYLKTLADSEELDTENVEWSSALTDLAEHRRAGKRLGKIVTEWDLLHYLPLRYLDKTNPQSVEDLVEDEWSVVAGTIAVDPEWDEQRQYTKIIFQDAKGKRISATFFRQKWLSWMFKKDDPVIAYGTYTVYTQPKTGRKFPQITNCKIDKIGENTNSDLPMIPIYPQKAGNKSWELQQEIRKLLDSIVYIEDPVPEHILKKYNLMSRNDAYRKIHFPTNKEDAERARTRIAFDDFIRLQVMFHSRKQDVERLVGSAKPKTALANQFISSLPFSLTGAQQRVIKEIGTDMISPVPMYRLLQGEVGSGKAQPLYSKVLTPTGFKTMGEMQIGDTVLTPDNGHAKVAGVFPQGKRPVYELTFRDGTKVRADENHLWSVRTTGSKFLGQAHKNLTTLEILNDLNVKNGYPKWYVDYPEIADYGQSWASPIDPYTLGCILGDGCLTSQDGIRFSVGEDSIDIISLMEEKLPARLYLRKSDTRYNTVTQKESYEYWFVKKPLSMLEPIENQSMEQTIENIHNLRLTGYTIPLVRKHLAISQKNINPMLGDRSIYADNPFVVELKRLGLQGTNSWTKFIPKELLYSDKASRLALLQGLLDTDGSVEIGRAYTYSSVSKQLAEDAAYLVRSLGGIARLVHKKRASGNSWQISGRLPSDVIPFRIARKREKFLAMPERVVASKGIISVEYVGEDYTQCIKLDDPRGLYITDDFTITHNTEISTYASLIAAESGFQVAFLAPTDILAAQMAERFQRDFQRANLDVTVALLTSKMKVKEKRALHERISDGTVQVLIGTHVILQKGVDFHNLGLVIVDEQHKFGTEQRSALREKNLEGGAPDMLTMSATPIPRTTSQVIYGDMDISVIDELPAERKPIDTEWIPYPDDAWDLIRQEVADGRQAYVVASLVEDSEKMENIESATETYSLLANEVFPTLNVGLLHGRMDAAQKKEVIESFYRNEVQILVATTVVEVGVNVPNASVMTILNANRFGIASLHQIRGRVGRGQYKSYCFLVGEATTAEAELRLTALTESGDGFYLAEKDLEIRGEGTLFDTKQSGDSGLMIGNLRHYKPILDMAKECAAAASSSKGLQQEIKVLYEGKTIGV